jgi:hypothetical protein
MTACFISIYMYSVEKHAACVTVVALVSDEILNTTSQILMRSGAA